MKLLVNVVHLNRQVFTLLACVALLTGMVYAQTPAATVNIDPNTLNLKSQGNWVTAFLTAGQYLTWEHGFLPADDYYNHPDVTTNIGLDTWYSYTSPNLMPLASPTPELILGLSVGGNGWDFHGKADSVVFSGVVGGVPTGNLISNGDFGNGFTGWTQTSGNCFEPPTWLIDTLDGTPAPCFEYQRTNSGSDGGWCGVYQAIGKDVSGWESLTASYDVKIISNSLTNSGWWSAYNNGWGETPGRIIVHYMANLDPEMINVSTVKLTGIDIGADGTVERTLNLPAVGPSSVNEHRMMVKFNRQALASALRQLGVTNNATVALIIKGNYNDGSSFVVSDKIRVLNK
ncbi:MAG: hypothetical protein NT018_03580 [Armatimonadetes bacterium]|nr:hypothetical protein [Armatimonadota bacterium]